MGKDISMAIEKYFPDKGWTCIGYEDDIFGKLLERNYGLYCILANTHDDYSFVDSETTISYIPIASARGIPPDADNTQDYAYKPFSQFGWYPSWVTLKEILDYPHWNTKVMLEQADGTSETMTYAERCKEFIEDFIPKLRSLTDKPEELRLVYTFW
jgi:hypothetical protein